jgi:transcriptional regulator with XRE-family HTH domain
MSRAPAAMDVWVGHRIRLKRLAVGWSADQLATECGVTRQQAEKWESGKSRMTAGRIYDVANMLGVHPGYFFDGHTGLAVPTDMGEDIREMTSAAGIQALAAMSRLTAEQNRIVRAIIDAFEKANLADRSLGDLMQRGSSDDGT